jgi:drug/metabolite transporter (DMT)-like permease
MAVGAVALLLMSALRDGAAMVARFTPGEWLAAGYLAAGGGALAFFLWVYALRYASPTRVANSMTINPIVAGLLAAAILDEPITLNLVIGLVAVGVGLLVATTDG